MRRFELVEGTSSKFWEVGISGSTLTTRWGRIGTDGQSKDKPFPNPAAAQKEHDKLVAEKTSKGYAEVGAATPASAKSAPAKPAPAKPAPAKPTPAKSATPTTTSSASARRFELVEDGSAKFWEISLEGTTVTTRWGRIGTDGQAKAKPFADAAAAQREYAKLVAEKTGKGYAEVDASAPKAAPIDPSWPSDVKELAKLAQQATTPGEPTTRVYIMVRGKKAPAKTDIMRAGGKTIGIDEKSRPRVPSYNPDEDPSEYMHHLWTLDLDQVPELRRFEKLANARAVALFIANAPNNECFEADIGRNYTRVVPITEADLKKGEWSGEIAKQPPGASLAVYPIEVPTRVFDTEIDFFELQEEGEGREQKLGELNSELMSADYINGSSISFQGDDHEGEFLAQFSESIVDVNLGDAGTMYVFSDLAFWSGH